MRKRDSTKDQEKKKGKQYVFANRELSYGLMMQNVAIKFSLLTQCVRPWDSHCEQHIITLSNARS